MIFSASIHQGDMTTVYHRRPHLPPRQHSMIVRKRIHVGNQFLENTTYCGCWILGVIDMGTIDQDPLLIDMW